MKRTVVINPEYKLFSKFINKIPENFNNIGISVYKARNELRKISFREVDLCVKSFKVPHLVNKFAYSFLRESKARRSYENSLKVVNAGFDSPMPVAYIEEYSNGLFYNSFYVCLFSGYTRLLREFAGSEISGREDIVDALGHYVGKMHNAGIYHRDLSPGNILFEKDGDEIAFSMIDNNRMSFEKVNFEYGCRGMERLRGSDDFFRILGFAYAEERGYDKEECFNRILQDSILSEKKFAAKRRRKRLFKSLKR